MPDGTTVYKIAKTYFKSLKYSCHNVVHSLFTCSVKSTLCALKCLHNLYLYFSVSTNISFIIIYMKCTFCFLDLPYLNLSKETDQI